MTDQPRLIGLDERVLWTCERGVQGLTPEEMGEDLRRQWEDLYRQFVAQAPNWRRTRARIAIRITVEDATRAAREGAGVSDDGMAYIGRAACGCVGAVLVDDPEHRREVAREIGRWVRQGLTVERATVEDVRRMTFRCLHKRTREGVQP